MPTNQEMKVAKLRSISISAYSVPKAVMALQMVGEQYVTIQGETVSLQNKKRSSSTIAGAVQKIAVLDDRTLDTLANICRKLQIPSTTGRLSRMVDLMKSNGGDYETAYASTTEDAMTEQNKTAAYNAAKMARSRISKVKEKNEQCEVAHLRQQLTEREEEIARLRTEIERFSQQT